jgi:hypothetical protein
MTVTWKCLVGAVVLYLAVLTKVISDLAPHWASADITFMEIAAVLLVLLVGSVAVVDGRKQIKARRADGDRSDESNRRRR